MKYEKVIMNILDSFGVNRSYTGYSYVVDGLLLVIEDPERLKCITKSLYLDIATSHHTSWNCVEKNIRTVVNNIWISHNTELLETICNKSSRTRKITNKEFLKYTYDYIVRLHEQVTVSNQKVKVVCPISNSYCASLELFYIRLGQMLE